MKKIISLLLVITMLFSVCVCGTITASAAETENLCKIFDTELSWFCCLYGLSPYRAYQVAMRTFNVGVHKDPDKFEQDERTFTYTVEKSYFNDLAEKLFQLDKSFEELLAEGENSSSYTAVDGDKYVITILPYSSSVNYKVKGYVKEGDTYSVYFQMVSHSYSPEYLNGLLQDNGYEGGFSIEDMFVNEDGTIQFWENGGEDFSTYRKLTVSYDGTYIKTISGEDIESIPALSDMITPDTTITPEPTPEPEPTPTPEPIAPEASVKYDVPAGVKVDGDSAFPANTVVKVENISAGEIFERAQNALKDAADKLAVYEFTATVENVAVQPNGKVKVSFDLPENLSAENLKIYYISADGKTEEIAITVDKESKTVTAELERFSTYVLANAKAETKDDGFVSPQTGNTLPVLPFVFMITSAFALAVLVGKRKQEN